MRVLVIGSPDWTDACRVHAALDECLVVARKPPPPTTLRVVHGGARKGAERAADAWVWEESRHGGDVDPPEVHAPRWNAPCRQSCQRGHRRPGPNGGAGSTCPSAPYYRNEEVVKLGADIALAFVVNGFRAAQHAVRLCQEHNIEVVQF